MANWTAIAAVTATLEASIRDALSGKVPNSTVSTGHPRQPAGTTRATVNLFLYSMAPSPSYRNEELPVRGADGQMVDRPVLAIDLFYLVSFLGGRDTYMPELLAGAVLTEFHTSPFLNGQRISDAVNAQTDLDATSFGSGTPDLERQTYRIRVNPMRLSTEDTTNLWSALGADFSTTLALEVSVVLLEPESPSPAPALPVLERELFVVPSRGPVIEAIEPSFFEFANAGTFRIRGSGFDAPNLVVNVGGREVTPTVLSANEIDAQLPPGTLAGVHPVRVIAQLEMGNPPQHRSVIESDVAVLVVRPVVSTTGSIANADAGAQVTPAIEPGQEVSLLLSRRGPGPTASEERRIVLAGATPLVPIAQDDLLPGDYFVRLRVDGAVSALRLEGGVPVGPIVTVP